MSEAMIAMLFRDLDRDLLDAIKFEKATVSKSCGKITIYINAKRLLTERELKKIVAAVKSGFSGADTGVKIMYPGLKQSFIDNPNEYKDFLIKQLGLFYPAASGFLSWKGANWSINNDILSVPVLNDIGKKLIQDNEADTELSNMISEYFGIELKTQLTVTDESRSIIEEIKREKEKLSAISQPIAKEETTDAPQEQEKQKPEKPKEETDPNLIMGRAIKEEPMPINLLDEGAGRCVISGRIVKFEVTTVGKNETKLAKFTLFDGESSVRCKAFISGKRGDPDEVKLEKEQLFESKVSNGTVVKVRGDYSYDKYEKETNFNVFDLCLSEMPTRKDTAQEKRVELHLHTKMSSMDSCVNVKDAIKMAAKWGHKAIAITDHGVLQAYPEAFQVSKKEGIKFIPGCEGYLIPSHPNVIKKADERNLNDAVFVVFDFETTGLNKKTDKIIEIGAVKMQNGVVLDTFRELVDPERVLSDEVIKLTGITNAELRGQDTIDKVMPRFVQFIGDSVLAAHNADFDTAFLYRFAGMQGYILDNPVLDTLKLSRGVFTDCKNFKLGTLCKQLNIDLSNAHRADHDAAATGQLLYKALEIKNYTGPLSGFNNTFPPDIAGESYHIILLAKSRKGMANLNRIVSHSHLKYFHRRPRMPRSLIEENREDLIIGSACEAGELFRAVAAGKSAKEIEDIASFYDYLEIQPIGNNKFMIENGEVENEEELRDLNRHIYELGKRLKKPVVATGDVHFMEPNDAVFRAVLMASKGFEDAESQAPLYFRTTDDMLNEFSYLGANEANEVVIEAPNQIADMVTHIKDLYDPAPDGGVTYQPFWPDAERELKETVYNTAHSMYGENLPEIVSARIEKELSSICGYGFSTLYMMAVRLVSKSLSDGYIVGSRGSVGSSLVAFLAGITEVNSLPAHYVCPKCKHSIWDIDKQYRNGLDLPAKNCPKCDTLMYRDGMNIPFEVFLGFKGDKVPDIDLNFSGDYQARAQNYVKEMFGTENVFRAGTITGLQDKTAYGYVLKYAEAHNIELSNGDKDRLVSGIIDVKKTSGQHPAGMVVVPEGYEIYDFTAVQHPADDVNSETITTHFDFSSMHDVLVKLDILGHDDPTMLKNLEILTGIPPKQVPLQDREVFDSILSLFSSTKALGVTPAQIGTEVGTYGIPEFGTAFVRGMLVETKPSSMEELVRISGLSHGTNVWAGNIQDIVKNKLATLKTAICTRDDVMLQLIDYGVEPKTAFDTMEYVRKGKAASGGLKPNMLSAMEENNVPQWFIDACNKIGYMFPKSHAVAYVTMALRIAYFKIYYPREYYACFLLRNADSFNALKMCGSTESLRELHKEDMALEHDKREQKKGEIALLESLIEMRERGIELLNVDLYESHVSKFLLKGDKYILPPLSSLPGLGLTAASNLAEIRSQGKFVSRDDMLKRKVGKSVIELLNEAGCLKDIPETSQVSLFEF